LIIGGFGQRFRQKIRTVQYIIYIYSNNGSSQYAYTMPSIERVIIDFATIRLW